MNSDKLIVWNVFRGALLVSWLLLSLISFNHLYPFSPFLSQLPTGFVGGLGWCTAFFAIVFCGRKHLRELFVLSLAFFIMGFVLGPFLEPPADPLEHLRRVHELSCGKTVEQMPRENRGVWQYSMMGAVLCTDGTPVQPEKMIRKIDITNGLFWALGSTVLLILGLQAGLPVRWAFFSVVTCFLFLGTNRFSYFRYYSLAPSFTSLCIYWLWVALFFFRKKARDIVKGLGMAISALPVIWVNHNQEAVFLAFAVTLWIGIICLEQKRSLIPVGSWKSAPTLLSGLFSVRFLFCCSLFFIFWLLPQSTSFLHWLSRFFSRGQWPHYQSLYVQWHGLYIGGKIAGLRIMDTLGSISIVSIVLAVPYFYFGFSNQRTVMRVRLFVLAILPFIIYYTPLFHFGWSSNVRAAEYYRFCYAAVFWLFLSDFLFGLEERICMASSSASCYSKESEGGVA